MLSAFEKKKKKNRITMNQNFLLKEYHTKKNENQKTKWYNNGEQNKPQVFTEKNIQSLQFITNYYLLYSINEYAIV